MVECLLFFVCYLHMQIADYAGLFKFFKGAIWVGLVLKARIQVKF